MTENTPQPVDIAAIQHRLDHRHGWAESAYFFNNACDDAEHAVAVLAHLLYLAELPVHNSWQAEIRDARVAGAVRSLVRRESA